MARYARRRSRRRSAYRKKGRRSARRTMRGPRRYGRKSVNTHHYKRKVMWTFVPPTVNTGNPVYVSNSFVANPQNVTGAVGGLSGTEFFPPQATANGCCLAWGQNFSLSRTDGYGEFSALYDEYKIRGVKIKLTFSATDYTAAAGQYNCPKLMWYKDDDDSNNPTTYTDIREFNQKPYVGSRQLANGKAVKLYLGSRTLSRRTAAVDSNGGVNYSLLMKGGWINLASPDVAHYGVKFLMLDCPLASSLTSAYQPTMRMEVTYYISLRGVR